MVFCVHEPQHAAQDPSLNYNIWCAKFYLRHTVRLSLQMRLRQFWLRILLAFGIFWGTMPLITVPFIFRGINDSTFDVLAAVCNSLTILPACVLAFWHRRVACIWLSVNGAIIVIALATSVRPFRDHAFGTLVGLAVPVLIAMCLDFMEMRRWPDALDRKLNSGLAQDK
jgi:hypothetical protein